MSSVIAQARAAFTAGLPFPNSLLVAAQASALVTQLRRRTAGVCRTIDPSTLRLEDLRRTLHDSDIRALVYIPGLATPPNLEPNVAHAEQIVDACVHCDARLILLSSTARYGVGPDHPGLVGEEHNAVACRHQPITQAWQNLETMSVESLGRDRVTILRTAPILVRGGDDFFSRFFTSRLVYPLTGHDPTLQFLSVDDLVRALDCAIRRPHPGTFNIVPAAPISLRLALRVAGRRHVAVPWTVQRTARRLAGRTLTGASPAQMQFVRYHLTASGQKAARELSFTPRDTSADAIRSLRVAERRRANVPSSAASNCDPCGLDPAYIDACRRGFLGVLYRRYWRVAVEGLDHVPRGGAAVLVGMHRGFMPFDGVMTLLSVVQGTGRIPRFLIHPGVGMRFPFLFNLMSKLGGMIACQDNADRVLESGELLGVYPEGIRGAFTMYARAHRIGPSWRNDCIVFALRHRVPIVPFVTIGSAEVFPIVGRIDWAWWKRITEWPFIPVTTPFPLPSKWHTAFLEPLHVERDHPPAAALDRAVVREIGAEVKRRMEAATTALLHRRRSIFFGSIFEGDER